MKKLFLLLALIIALSNALFSQWEACNYDTLGPIISELNVSSNAIFAVCTNGLFLSIDNGNTWEKKIFTFGYINSLAISGNNIFIAAGSDGVILSTDYGKTWVEKNKELGDNGWGRATVIKVINNKVLAGVNNKICISTDLGDNWIQKDIGLPRDYVILSFEYNQDKIFAGSWGIFVSSDEGNNWTWKTSGLQYGFINSLAVYGNNIFASSLNNSGIFKSSDNAEHWIHITNGFSYYSIAALAVNDSNIFAANNLGVFLSKDIGNNWTLINSGLTYIDVRTLAIIGDYIFAGTNGGGLFRAKLSDFGITSVEEPKPKVNNLKISPNPANDWLYISENDELNEKEINVYSVIGEKLWSRKTEGKEMKINIESFPAGVYFLRVGNEMKMFVKCLGHGLSGLH
jgi:photosystem II stability/assembly factor-like uncharacterized protein